jgi:hypothetical protein
MKVVVAGRRQAPVHRNETEAKISAIMNVSAAMSVSTLSAWSQTDTAAKKIADARMNRPRYTARSVRN